MPISTTLPERIVKIYIVTRKRLHRAKRRVTAELHRSGLWGEPLARVPVVLTTVGVAYGWKYQGRHGRICIPRISLARLQDATYRATYVPLVDVLRHEYGHAVLDLFPMAVRPAMRSFARAMYFDPHRHVTAYAATSRAEDFCETFMLYLKYRGHIPDRLNAAKVRRKWLAISRLCDRLSREPV